ncbi:MAG TPA: hypothetical protein VK308_14575 [Pyrinomonadaceae bacterium]|nr:hypothetical protein [Pyrinomonadaceae bacterium]
MNCPNCGGRMSYGAPHCETIKTQLECGECGLIEPEYYSREELILNELVQQHDEATYQDCRTALENNDYDVRRAERELDERQLDRICRNKSNTTGETFAQTMMNKPLSQITDAGLQFLTLAAGNPNQN